MRFDEQNVHLQEDMRMKTHICMCVFILKTLLLTLAIYSGQHFTAEVDRI